jgi:hypothetical protein
MATTATKVVVTFSLQDDDGTELDSATLNTPINETDIFGFEVEVEDNAMTANGPIIRPKRPRI